MLSGIVTGAPIWVWPLLVLLVVLGWRASRRREVPVAVIFALPLMGLLSLRAVHGLEAGALAWGLFIAAYGAGGWSGAVVQRGWIIAKGNGRVTLKGEWLTMVQVVTIFAMNFAAEATRAIAPDIEAGPVFPAVFAAVAGAVAGLFAGRAVAVLLAPSDRSVSVPT